MVRPSSCWMAWEYNLSSIHKTWEKKTNQAVYYSPVERYLTGFISLPGWRVWRRNCWTKNLIYQWPLGQIKRVPMTHREKGTLKISYSKSDLINKHRTSSLKFHLIIDILKEKVTDSPPWLAKSLQNHTLKVSSLH